MNITLNKKSYKSDKKKKQMLSSMGTTTAPNNPLGYATTLFRQLFTFGIMIVIGTTMVYSGKVAQANILPTNINCFPYTNVTPTIDKVDVCVVKVGTYFKFILNNSIYFCCSGCLPRHTHKNIPKINIFVELLVSE